ncbi:hypothetical protein K438DRAFT_1266022 [Mycena galopus ATCC 62051]|nr:hypothetical protein K438DRAFT_1266022 [Mycena galopus ATCC 62051]
MCADGLRFADGGLIIQAEMTLFRVYRNFLAMHSAVFRDMLIYSYPRGCRNDRKLLSCSSNGQCHRCWLFSERHYSIPSNRHFSMMLDLSAGFLSHFQLVQWSKVFQVIPGSCNVPNCGSCPQDEPQLRREHVTKTRLHSSISTLPYDAQWLGRPAFGYRL